MLLRITRSFQPYKDIIESAVNANRQTHHGFDASLVCFDCSPACVFLFFFHHFVKFSLHKTLCKSLSSILISITVQPFLILECTVYSNRIWTTALQDRQTRKTSIIYFNKKEQVRAFPFNYCLIYFFILTACRWLAAPTWPFSNLFAFFLV